MLDQLAETTDAAVWEVVKKLQEAIALLSEAAAAMRRNGAIDNADSLEAQAAALESELDSMRSTALSHERMLSSG